MGLMPLRAWRRCSRRPLHAMQTLYHKQCFDVCIAGFRTAAWAAGSTGGVRGGGTDYYFM